MNIDGLDNKDNEILSLIADNARMSYSDIGEKVGLSRVSVKNRMRILEEKGIIKGYKTVIDAEKSGESIRFFLDVESYPEFWDEVCMTLSKSPLLRQIYVTSGECHIHAIGIASSTSGLNTFTNYLYRNVKGVKRIGCHTVLGVLQDPEGGIVYDQCRESVDMERNK